MERLQKRIAHAGICSRRHAEKLILDGRVKVNNETVVDLGFKVSDKDIVMVDNKVLETEKKEYYILNKPRQVISSVSDPQNRKTVVDFIATEQRIYPVGRLDYGTTGLILLTNDGELVNQLIHPKNNIEKTYLVKIKDSLHAAEIAQLQAGITINGSKTKPAKIMAVKYDKKTQTTRFKIIITEGKNHQIKKMLQYFDKEVLKLKRIQFAFLTLENLNSGQYRELNKKEIKKLYSLIKKDNN